MTTSFPGAIDAFPVLSAAGGDKLDTAGKEHDVLHNQANDAIKALEQMLFGWFFNVKSTAWAGGAKGDGTTNDTAAIAACIAAAPAGSTVFFPPGTYKSDAIAITKQLHFKGGGRWDSVLSPRTALTSGTPFVYFNLPSSSPSIFGYYGASFESMGIDATSSPLCTAVLVSQYSQWTLLRDFAILEARIGIDHRGINGWIEDGFVADATVAQIKVDNDTGGQLTIRDVGVYRNLVGITQVGVDIQTTGTGGASVYIDNLTVGGYVTSTTHTEIGIRAQCATAFQSNPVFIDHSYMDNCWVTAVEIINVADFNYSDGWINAGTLGPAVRITGGDRLRFSDNQMFGGPTGSVKTYEFVGGATKCFTSVGNYLPSGPTYVLPSSGKPVGPFWLDDHLVGATGPADVTNDMAYLTSIVSIDCVPHKYAEKMTFRESGTNPPRGASKLVAGVKVINHGGLTSVTRVRVDVWLPSGTIGTVYCNILEHVTGPSGNFTVRSTSATDTSDFLWSMEEAT